MCCLCFRLRHVVAFSNNKSRTANTNNHHINIHQRSMERYMFYPATLRRKWGDIHRQVAYMMVTSVCSSREWTHLFQGSTGMFAELGMRSTNRKIIVYLFTHIIATILVGSQVKRSKTTPIAEIRKIGTSCTGFCWFWLPIQTLLSHIHIAIMSYDAPSNRFAPNCPCATRRIECGIWVGSIFRFVILFSFHGCSRYPLSHHKNAYFLIALDAPCPTHVTYTSELELNHSTHSTRKQMSAEAQHGVIWLYHGSGHLWAAPHSERDLALLAVVHRPLAMECLDVGSLGELKYSWFLLVLAGSR